MQKGEQHPGANFDDEHFIVNQAQKLPREAVMALMVEIAAAKDDLEDQLEDDWSDRALQRAFRRKKRQTQWCQVRLGIMKAEKKLKADPIVKADRRDSFHAHFFDIAQDDLPKDHFTRLCKLAEAEVSDDG